jgi:hypothetical protein
MRLRRFLLGFAPALVLACQPALSQTTLGNIQLPGQPQFPQGQDKIRAADGTECAVSTAPRDKYMDVGFVGGGSSGTGVENSYPYIVPGTTLMPSNQYNRVTGGVYMRIVINLDAKRPRIDCNRLYELEIQRLRAEIEQLRLIGVGTAVGSK